MNFLKIALNESGKYLYEKDYFDLKQKKLQILILERKIKELKKKEKSRIVKIQRIYKKQKEEESEIDWKKLSKELLKLSDNHMAISDFKILDKINIDEKGWNKI